MKALSVVLGTMTLAIAGCSANPEAGDAAEPASEEVSPAPSDAEEDIRHWLLQEYPDSAPLTYALAWSDLDGDGADEAIIHLAGPMVCGSGGCNTLVLTRAGPMWRAVGDMSVSRTPVTVLDTVTNGWRDLTVDIAGGGGPSGTVRMAFDGEAYPRNPTVLPDELGAEVGEVLIAEDAEFSTLEPAE